MKVLIVKKWLLILATCLAVEWAVFSGIVWLVTWFFGWSFHLGKATCLWVFYILIRDAVRRMRKGG